MTRGVFVAGDVSSSELNACFNKPRVRVYNSVNISLVNATDQGATYDSEVFDTHGLHSTSVNTGRLTIPSGEDGYYHVGVNGRFATSATGSRRIGIWVNGITTGTRIAHILVPPASGIPTVITLTTYWPFSSGDYIETAFYQDSGGALNLERAASYSPEFWAVWDAPL